MCIAVAPLTPSHLPLTCTAMRHWRGFPASGSRCKPSVRLHLLHVSRSLPSFLFDSGDAGQTPFMFSTLNGLIRDRWATTLHGMEEKKCIRGIIRSTQQTRNQYASRWFTLAHSQLASDSSITNRIGHLAVQHYHLRFDLRVLTSAFRSIQLELCVSL